MDAGVDLGSENIKITVVGGKLDIGRSESEQKLLFTINTVNFISSGNVAISVGFLKIFNDSGLLSKTLIMV